MMVRNLQAVLFVVSATVVLSSPSAFAQENDVSFSFPAIERGDTNGDWERDLSDAVYLLNHLFAGGPAPAPIHVAPGVTSPLSGDNNGDESHDLSDAIYLLSWLYLGGPAPVGVDDAAPLAGGGAGRAIERSIEEWVDAQGTFCVDDGMGGCVIFVPPVANFLGWIDPAANLAASIDYAGLADGVAGQNLGTTTTGSVTERPLGDGTSEYHVRLHTKNAISWAIEGTDFGGAPTIFGNRVNELNGDTPALGQSLFHAVYTGETGAPLTDIFASLGTTTRVSFHGQADGTRSDGSAARLQVSQTGVFMTGGGGATADGFPAEYVRILSTGG